MVIIVFDQKSLDYVNIVLKAACQCVKEHTVEMQVQKGEAWEMNTCETLAPAVI